MLHTLLRSAIVWLALTGASLAEGVTVFAAASLRDALDEVAEEFETTTGIKMVMSYAGSSVLARQIGFGAPADIFISANAEWMDWLQERGSVISESRTNLLSNRLVLVTSYKYDAMGVLSRTTDIHGLLQGGRLAMALVDAVPAGIYGKQALQNLGQWEAVAPDVVQTDNVRAALALAALGEARMAVVYETDAKAEPKVWTLGTFPEDSHPQITYPAAQVSDKPTAKEFFVYLQSETAQEIFLRHGFLIPEAE